MNSIRMRLVWSVSAVLLIPSLFLPATAEERANWPQFLGPRGRAIQETADPPENLDLTHGVGWKIKIPTGHSSPCIWGNSIFLTAFQSEPPELETMCIDRMTGEIRWQKACGDVQQIEKVHEVSNPAAPTPVTDGETVVVYFGSYGLVAYDFDGNEIWKRPLPIARAGSFGSGSSPIIAGDQVIIWVPQNRESYLGAYRLTDGKELWKAQRVQSNRTWATPILWHAGESSRVGLLASGKFTAFDAASGEEVWWVNEVATNSGSTPKVVEQRLLITSAGIQGDEDNILVPDSFDSFLKRFDADEDGKIAFSEIPDSVLFTKRHTTDGAGDMPLTRALTFTGVKPNHVFDRAGWKEMRQRMEKFKQGPMCRTSAALIRIGGDGDVTQSHRIWEQPRGVGEVPSPLAYRGLVYLLKNGGILTTKDLETGEQVYTKRLPGATGGYYASPIAADGRIYLANDAGILTVIEAGPTLKVLSQCDVGEPIFATPAIIDDALYVRSQRHLIHFRKAARPF